MRIGPYSLPNKLILAPMAGTTDRPFRQLCRRFGAALAISEMITADTSLWGSRKSLRRLDHGEEAGPVAVQIVGGSPAKMAEAARRNAALGADIIDINMGCPAKKVCKVAAGSALMRDEPLVARILEAVVTAVDIPVTLKIRTGWDRSCRNAVAIAHAAENAGIAAIAIHGRTRADRFSGAAEYETIRDVKRQVKIPVIANGDIDQPEKAARVLAYTGADAIMIGRAAQGRPWIFDDMHRLLENKEPAARRSNDWVRDLVLEHLDSIYGFYGSGHGVHLARKHVAWYSKNFSGGGVFRAEVFRAETPQQQKELVRAFFGGPTKQRRGALAA